MHPFHRNVRRRLYAVAVSALMIGLMTPAQAQGPYSPRNLEVLANLPNTHAELVSDFDWALWRRQNYLSIGMRNLTNRRLWDLWGHGAYDLEMAYARHDYLPYTGDTWGAMGGLDRAFGPLMLGVSGGYFNRVTKFDAPQAKLNSDVLNIGIYGSWDPRPLAIDAGVCYTHTNDHTTRWVPGLSPTLMARGDTESDYLSTFVFARYDLPLAVFTLTPTIGMRYASGRMGGWEERDAGDYDLFIDRSTRESIVSDLGLVLVSEILPVWQVQLFAFWEREYRDNQSRLTARYRGDDTVFSVSGMDLGRDAARVGAILSRDFSRKFTFYAAYEGLFRDRYDNHQVNIGGLLAF